MALLGCETSRPANDSGIDGFDAAVDALDTVPQCTQAQTRCGGSCSDLQNDREHCGDCANVCPGGQACVGGHCAIACPSGQMLCGGLCVSTATDVANCGACGTTCPTGQVCSMGTCGLVCASPLVACGGDDAGIRRACADTARDRANCGACQHTCSDGEICVGGSCVLSCPAGQTPCAGSCATLESDRANCGACGAMCGSGEVCAAGRCALTCGPTLTTCGGGDAGGAPYCADTTRDRENCGACGAQCAVGEVCRAGACGVSCPSGQTDCAGACVTLDSDRGNCGACGASCAAGEVCVAGACAVSCGATLTMCGDGDGGVAAFCTDTTRDRANCGSCGNACASGEACTSGACVTSCGAGLTDCGGSCRDVRTDGANCGACGRTCAVGEVCSAGMCTANCALPLVACNGVCVDTRFDPGHCGACNRMCGVAANTVAVCANGTCGSICTSGYDDCDANATNGCETDTASDVRNCGTCGRICTTGLECFTGACVAPLGPPRPIAPLSTARATSRRPTLRWSLPSGSDGTRVQMCSDRACSTVITSFDATGTSGSPSVDLPAGVVFWRAFARSGARVGTAAGPVWEVIIPARTASRDLSHGARPDVNGDGYMDLITGAGGPSGQPGHAYEYLGAATGLPPSPTLTLTGPDGASGGFGYEVVTAGDVNGDGFVDIAVGAGCAVFSASMCGSGRVHIYHGGPSGLPISPSRTLVGPGAAYARFGYYLSGAGDINGDGYADLVATSAANLLVYLGSATGLPPSPSATIALPSSSVDLAGGGDLNGDGFADVVVQAAAQARVYFGSATGLGATPVTLSDPSGGGTDWSQLQFNDTADVDGDGLADLAVGAYCAVSTIDMFGSRQCGSGRVYIFRGTSSGVETTPGFTLSASTTANARFGETLADAGDANGDGYVDLLVGARSEERSYLFFGGPAGPTGSPVAFAGPDPAANFGYGVSGLGDVDRDGFDDIAIGAYAYNNNTGRVYWYRGTLTGPATTPTASWTGYTGIQSAFGNAIALLFRAMRSPTFS